MCIDLHRVNLHRMVFSTNILFKISRSSTKSYKGFVDRLRVHVKAGSGGSGLPKYGGRGGNGGNVYFVTKEGLSLNVVRKAIQARKVHAEPGNDSASKAIVGAPGKDLHVYVPPGVTVYNEHGIVIGDLNESHAKLLIAKGGLGGCKETAYVGMKGEVQNITLDLKLIADIGLVGFPNAGKSTLLSVISKAKPKIANYPFTTIRPQLGMIEYDDHRQITVADLPGLIEGAHANYGLGHKFLKHLGRTKMHLYIVDIQGFQLSAMHVQRDCMETVLLLNKEIELYNPDLLDTPAVILLNKMDTENSERIYEIVKSSLNNFSQYVAQCPPHLRPTKLVQFDCILTASLINRNKPELDAIKHTIREILDKYAEENNPKIKESLSELKNKLEGCKEKHAVTLT